MNGVKGKFAAFTGRLRAERRQNKKKTTALVILLIVAGIVSGRLAVTSSPAEAAASAKASRADQGQNSERQARQADFASTDRAINRDLFQPDAKYFPSAREGVASEVANEKTIRKPHGRSFSQP